MLLAFTAGGAFASAPIAGTAIGNQATASYYDSVQGKTVNVTSNTVTTTVQQVASLTLAIDAQTKTVSVGGTVYFMHTVTNTGNGNDTFTLAAVKAGGSSSITVPATIYSDNSGTVGTPLSPAQTITLAPGATFNFWYSAVASASAAATDTATATVTATSTFSGTVKATNTDTINVTPYANLAVTKSIDSVTTAGGITTIQYRIHYVNNGNNTAKTFTITDATPAGATYSASSAWWSDTGSGTKFGNASQTYGTAPNTITYDYGVTAGSKITAVINQVIAGAQGDLTYQVTFPAATAGGTVITNTATYTYDDGSGPVQPKGSGSATISYTVPVVRSVAVTDAGSTTDSDGANGTVLVASAPQGGVVWFDNVVQNNGNVADTYQMSNSGSTFPASTIQYYDGLNGNLLPGGVTGSIPAGGSAHVWVKVTLTTGGTGGPFQLTLTATSSNDNTKTGSDTDKLTAITAAAVDITDGTARSDSTPAGTAAAGNAATTGFGVQPTGEAAAVATVTGSNAAPAVFPLYLNNTGANDEAYILSYSNSGSSSTALPAGWTVAFYSAPASGTCAIANLGAPLSGNTTGTITAGHNEQICAVVTPPAGATGGVTVDVYVKATGSNTGANDIIHNAVSVAKAYSVTITPNNTGLIAPNGSKIYNHTVTNTSNLAVAVNAGDLLFTVPANTKAGWTAILCADSACSTLLTSMTGTDGNTYYDIKQLVGAGGLPAGGTVSVYVKVQAPATTVGDQNITTISLASFKSTPAYKIVASATDSTTMSLANTTIQKYQALDTTCDGTNGGSSLTWVQTGISAGAVPGACIRYKLVVNNGGNQPATQLAVTDLVPAYTVYNKLGNCFPASGGQTGSTGASGDIDGVAIAAASISEPSLCAASGAGVAVTYGTGSGLTLNAGSTATLYFEVQISK
jgi:uncharacterized repeat protein (TIGR01451 family)